MSPWTRLASSLGIVAKATPQQLFKFWVPSAAPSLVSRNYLAAYSKWVYAGVKAISNDVATAEFKLQKRSGEEWKDVADHPAMRVLERPNPFTTVDDLLYGGQAFLELVGNAFFYVAYNRAGQPAELWQLDPTKVTIVRDEKRYIGGYEYWNERGQKVMLKPNEVIHFKDFNPHDPLVGMGSIRPAALSIDIDTYASEYNRDFFYNSAIPGLLLSTEQNLSDDQYERLMRSWLDKHQGRGNAHKPDILEGGLKPFILSPSLRELNFVDQQKAIRDEILGILMVPKSVLGITEDVNRANAEASEYVFAKRTISPRLRFLASRLTAFYLPLWGLDPNQYRIVAADVVPIDQAAELARKEAGIKGGWYTINEVRAEEGLPPVKAGDVPYVPVNLTPLGVTPPTPDEGEQPGGAGEGEEPAKAIVKAAYSSTDQRARYFTHTINTAQPEYLDVLQQMQGHVLRSLAAAALKAAVVPVTKDDNPNDVPGQGAELERSLFADWARFLPLFREVTQRVTTEVLAYAGRRTLASAGIESAFDLANPRAVAWLRENALSMATQVSDTIKGDLRKLLTMGVENGQSIDDIAASMRTYFEDQSDWRALRIARTEVMNSYAEGSLEAARQHTLTEKRWVTSATDPAEVCAQNAAQGWIARESAFQSGHLTPTSHPNCKCEVEFRAP